MLDIEPSDIDEKPSEEDKGGVSPPELDVHVLDRERVAGLGREKTGIDWTRNEINPCARTMMVKAYMSS
jgi:hypothetical protein